MGRGKVVFVKVPTHEEGQCGHSVTACVASISVEFEIAWNFFC